MKTEPNNLIRDLARKAVRAAPGLVAEVEPVAEVVAADSGNWVAAWVYVPPLNQE